MTTSERIKKIEGRVLSLGMLDGADASFLLALVKVQREVLKRSVMGTIHGRKR